MNVFLQILLASWNILLESSPYILLGILVAGLINVFLKSQTISKHLGTKTVKSVFKASLLGVPLPLCSCGVLPMATSLKRQGATKGAISSFLISTPESGVDSIAITYALLDPIMTVVRPIAAFTTAIVAGILENISSVFVNKRVEIKAPDQSSSIDGCCDCKNCSSNEHKQHHTFFQKLNTGIKFAFKDLWGDIATWFFLGIIIAGIITAVLPANFIYDHLGSGIVSMFLVLLLAVPLYICASASTPIAAALILKGMSPGVALVFLLVGPATNIASLTVLIKILGKRSTAIYLISIVVMAILFGMMLDKIYLIFGVNASASIGEASEMLPYSIKISSTIFVILISLKPITQLVIKKIIK